MSKIKFKFGFSNLEKITEDVYIYASTTEAKVHTLVYLLTQEGYLLTYKNVSMLDVKNITGNREVGDITAGISWSANGYEGNIYVTDKEVVFLEFGAGMVGANSPHPSLPSGVNWNFNVGTHIFVTKSGKTGWIYEGVNGQRFWEGWQSYHPVFDASVTLDEIEFMSIVKSVF